MKNNIPHIIALAAGGLLAMACNATQAQTTYPIDQSQFPTITVQPLDQVVPIGGNATLSVQATNADTYQWQCNGVSLDGQTNNSLAILNAGINSVGLYSCNVSQNGGGTVPTRAANVLVYMTSSSAGAASLSAAPAGSSSVMAVSGGVAPAGVLGGGPITVFGTPLSGGGKKGSCPGPYTGYINYTKTVSQGWGWSPSGTVHTVADGSGRTDTKVEFIGAYGDSGCNQTTVSIPNPTYSPVYRFTIYFTNNIPTNAYPITLTGFNP